ncbi:MAG: helix-hairpin-helix domain-containing protein [Cyanobacteria bacterium]|nr:helix-hairpin-helix domain-containing protein [Cyanobacteriota bacterium]
MPEGIRERWEWFKGHWDECLIVVMLLLLVSGGLYLLWPEPDIPVRIVSRTETSPENSPENIATEDVSVQSTDMTTQMESPNRAKKSKKYTRAKKVLKVVRINQASASELLHLPGIGPALAQRIISYRKQFGSFKTVDELDKVSGIGPKKLAAMRPFIKI